VECPPGKKAIYDENNKVTILRPWLILLNNFCHDLFTGLWFGSFIVLYVLRDYVKEQGAEMGQPGPWLGELNSFFYTFIWIALLLICITGLFRFLYDRKGDGGIGDNWQLKKQMLIVKHAVLGVSFVGGSILGYLWTH
jgi:uncharacterized membrane protein